MRKIITFLTVYMLSVLPNMLCAQITVGGTVPDNSASLDMQSATRGFLLPRMTTADRNSIVSPATGLMIFNTGTLCMEINQGTPVSPEWSRVSCREGEISSLNCGVASVSGSEIAIPYTGGNGGVYTGQTVTSTGVAGLTATLSDGNFMIGDGSLVWNLAGNPSAAGTANLVLEAGTQVCTVNVVVVAGTVTALDCGAASVSGDALVEGVSVSGSDINVPYSGGNSGFYTGQTIPSTGVTGLTATLAPGFFANGSGMLSFDITGTPSGSGTATFAVNTGGQMCTIPVNVVAGSVAALNCAGATIAGTLYQGITVSGAGASVPYTGGNAGTHTGQTVTSTGVTGLTAMLSTGSFVSGSGNLSYTITGTPSAAGTATFALNIGGQTCNLEVTVSAEPVCRAKVNATTYKNFSCYNLGAANTSTDPFTPSWEIIGGYWQWGSLAQAAAGPTGPGAGQAGDGAVSGWSTTAVPDGSWSDASKTANDPCPSGYRVPSKAQWDGVIANNTITDEGAFSNGATNYSAGKNLGDNLMLPVAGLRSDVGGGLIGRGVYGYYWSSTVTVNSLSARGLYLYPGGTLTYTYSRTYGFPVRCIEEYTGSVGAVNCSGATITGTLRVDQAASGVSASVPYTGGNAGPHSGQTVTSTGVTGLTATLASGNFVSESGSLSYAITGTPSAAGTATFALNIGGKTCSLEVTVAAGPPVCRAKVDAVNYKNFMCYNLGAANTSADPFTPSWEIIGGYWQWGRLAQAVAGPAGPDAGQANDGAVSGWITTYAPDGSWSDASKTANDPCPSGYRIPTKAQWEGVVANNTITSIGTSSDSATNYSSGIKFGTNLFLPNAGKRKYNNGALEVRGSYGYYWSSSASSTNSGLAGYLRFVSTLTTVNFNDRAFGFSVRCIAQ